MTDYKEIKEEVADIIIDLADIVSVKFYHYTDIPDNKHIVANLKGIGKRIQKLRLDIIKDIG